MLDFDFGAYTDFKVMQHDESVDGTSMIEPIINRLEQDGYDAMIYFDKNAFVLQNLSILFDAISFEKYHFGGIWSFREGKGGSGYKQCLLSSMFIVNIEHIRKYKIDYAQMLREELFCSDLIDYQAILSKSVDIHNIFLNEIKEKSVKYGIVALPWWYIMDTAQFETYYTKSGDDDDDGEKNEDVMRSLAAMSNPQMIVSWMEYIHLFEQKTNSDPIPLVIDMNGINQEKEESFWTEWSSIRQQTVQSCENLSLAS